MSLRDAVRMSADEVATFLAGPRTLNIATVGADGAIHIVSNDGPATVAALMDLARAKNVQVKKVSVQSTTLDDVFLHFTGSDLRDAAKQGVGLDVGHLYR